MKIVAGKGAGLWVFSTLEVQLENEQKSIDLIRGKIEIADSKAYIQVHAQAAVEPDIPSYVPPAPTSDGAFPVVTIMATGGNGGPVKFEHSFGTHQPSVRHDSPVNSFDVDLRSGMFVLRQTDLFVKDVMPLSLTRTYRQWDKHIRALGMGTNHPYDICPTGSRNPYTFSYPRPC